MRRNGGATGVPKNYRFVKREWVAALNPFEYGRKRAAYLWHRCQRNRAKWQTNAPY
jgi:hypothetical protein